jgi:hypothetical protein
MVVVVVVVVSQRLDHLPVNVTLLCCAGSQIGV